MITGKAYLSTIIEAITRKKPTLALYTSTYMHMFQGDKHKVLFGNIYRRPTLLSLEKPPFVTITME